MTIRHRKAPVVSLAHAVTLRNLRAIQELYIEESFETYWTVWLRVITGFNLSDMLKATLFLVAVVPRGKLVIHGKFVDEERPYPSDLHPGSRWVACSFDVTVAPIGTYSEVRFMGPGRRWSNLRSLGVYRSSCKLECWNTYFTQYANPPALTQRVIYGTSLPAISTGGPHAKRSHTPANDV